MLSIAGSLGSNVYALLDFEQNHRTDIFTIGGQLVGEFAGSAGVGIIYDVYDGDESRTEIDAFFRSLSTNDKAGFRMEIDINENNEFKELRLHFLKSHVLHENGYNETLVYIVGPSQLPAVLQDINTTFKNLLNLGSEATQIQFYKREVDDIVRDLFSKAYEIQKQNPLKAEIYYYKTRDEISNISSFPIGISAGLNGIIEIDCSVGTEMGFEETNTQIVERGFWKLGKHYPLEIMHKAIPDVNMQYQEKVATMLFSLPEWLISNAFSVQLLSINKKNLIHHFYEDGSYIEFAENAIPVGLDSLSCAAWGWYGNSPETKKSNLQKSDLEFYTDFKRRAEETYGMQHAIGGFYQFEPFNTELLDTCWMTIVYDDEELEGITESSLAMYYEDKANHRWAYLGGILDTVENKVTCPITSLSNFTLAPSMPFGEFNLVATPDSIYADSVSVANIISDTIFNNNLQPVSEGEVFTIGLTQGKILSSDVDTSMPGIQIIAMNHRIQFDIQSTAMANEARVIAKSVKGSANASLIINYYDTLAPTKPNLISAIADSSIAVLNWMSNLEQDLSGYLIYYDTDTLPPFNGIHTVYGLPSPITISTDTTKRVDGLLNDTTYYFAIKAMDESGNLSEFSNFISVKPMVKDKQLIHLHEGWSGLSSYMNPIYEHTSDIFDEIKYDLIILQNNNGMYWPGQNVNTLGNWNMGQGYKIKVAEDVNLSISGSRLENQNLGLAQSWNLMPVLSECPADVAELFNGTDVSIVKEVAGWRTYWPAFGINTLQVLEPGKAYFALMNSEGEIEFPECTPSSRKLSGSPSRGRTGTLTNGATGQCVGTPFPWRGRAGDGVSQCVGTPFPSNDGGRAGDGVSQRAGTPFPSDDGGRAGHGVNPTAISHNIALPVSANSNSILLAGDIIGVFDNAGNCYGLAEWNGANTALTVFGNDPLTAAKDGFDQGEMMVFKLYRMEDESEITLEVEFNYAMPQNAAFAENGLSAISGIKSGSTGIANKGQVQQSQIVPNPAHDAFTLMLDLTPQSTGKLELYNLKGQLMKQLTISGQSTKVEIDDLSAGVYVVNILIDNQTMVKQLIKH